MVKYEVSFGHANDVVRFVDVVNKFDCDVDLKNGSRIVDAKSLIGVLALSQGNRMEMVVHANECSDLIQRIQPYVTVCQLS